MFTVPDHAISETFLAASGPGGQNVNKVATAVQMRVDITALNLAPYASHQLKKIAGRKLTANGELVILVRKYRTREANRIEARKHVNDILLAAHKRTIFRVKTKPSRAAKARRVDIKKKKSTVKKMRGKPVID